MKQLFYVFIVFFLLEACSEKKESLYPVINPMEHLIDSREGEKLYFGDVKIVQLDNQQIVLFGEPILLDSMIMINSFKDGVFLYDMAGQFLRKIGSIGQGPQEYSNARFLAWDMERNLIYVFSKPNILLTYSLEGECLKRIRLELPGKLVVKTYVYHHNFFYLMNFVGLAEQGREDEILWLKVDTLGQIVERKALSLSELKIPENGTMFTGDYCSVSAKGIVYDNHFCDTIYSINETKNVPVAVWAKGDFRLTSADAELKFGHYGKVIFQSIDETTDKFFVRWYTFYHDKPLEHFLTVCDKGGGENRTFRETYPVMNANFCSSRNGEHFLIYVCEPLALSTFLSKSDNEELRNEGDKIDEEGNFVLVIVPLKETI